MLWENLIMPVLKSNKYVVTLSSMVPPGDMERRLQFFLEGRAEEALREEE